MKKNKKLTQFINENLPSKKSRKDLIKTYGDEIMELRKHGYNFNQITIYIEDAYKIKTSRQMISDIYKELTKEQKK